MDKVMNVQIDMAVKGFNNLRKVIRRDLEGGVNVIILVATSPSGEDREVWSHSVFGLMDGPVSLTEKDEIIPLED